MSMPSKPAALSILKRSRCEPSNLTMLALTAFLRPCLGLSAAMSMVLGLAASVPATAAAPASLRKSRRSTESAELGAGSAERELLGVGMVVPGVGAIIVTGKLRRSMGLMIRYA